MIYMFNLRNKLNLLSAQLALAVAGQASVQGDCMVRGMITVGLDWREGGVLSARSEAACAQATVSWPGQAQGRRTGFRDWP